MEEKEEGEEKVEMENNQSEENIRTKRNILEGELKEKYKWLAWEPSVAQESNNYSHRLPILYRKLRF